jgi:hypothetical protein
MEDPDHIVTCIPIARQRLGKHVPAVNTPLQQRGCCVCEPRLKQGIIEHGAFCEVRAK